MQQLKHSFEHYSSLFSEIGADPAGGMTRLLYSPEWVNAQQTLKTVMEQNGLEAYFDEVGNLFGRLPGSKYPEQVVMSGSHIDTVVNGGNLDGQYGILAALIALEHLRKTYGAPLRTLEVVSFAEEEGSRFPYVFWGSKNMFALASKEEVLPLQDAKGIKFTDAMQKAGFRFRADNSAPRQDIHAFIELHIEQGKVLETLNKQLGVVTSIAGQKRYTITLKGEANHAG
ncbi:MAG: hydantoinase/carbamoylase family amidase, partial [Enterobacteriaceae bacterium]